jgi:hypothetical protein
MVCPMVDACGFGCALHHATYCFIAALSDNRTVVFEDDAHKWPHVLPSSLSLSHGTHTQGHGAHGTQ